MVSSPRKRLHEKFCYEETEQTLQNMMCLIIAEHISLKCQSLTRINSIKGHSESIRLIDYRKMFARLEHIFVKTFIVKEDF